MDTDEDTCTIDRCWCQFKLLNPFDIRYTAARWIPGVSIREEEWMTHG